jgi:hypothetical protein
MVDEGGVISMIFLRKALIVSRTQNTRYFLESFLLVLCPAKEFDKAFIQEKPFQT